jgi:[acyl-carrier-protein] S-malonyltransferase
MGRSLCEGSRAAREIFLAAGRILGDGFLQTCFSGPDGVLAETSICQPALFVHGCAAVSALLEKFPEEKYAVAYGLSLGELTALWAAGVFDFETGLKVVAERGRLMEKACLKTDGAMLCLIGGTPDAVGEVCCSASVEPANVNCPGQIVVSGETKNIEKAMSIAEKMPFRRALRLNVSGAYHSKLMESASVGFEKFLRNVDFQVPRIEVLTNVTGMAVSLPDEIRAMLCRQIVSPVLFEKCCRTAMESGVGKFFECGPGRTLSGMLRKIDDSVSVRNFDRIEDFDA